MKVTTEKLPKSLLALDIELDKAQVEKSLDRAARRISQKVTIPGFRKGKAPRFIVENYYGRPALVEEAYDDLVNRSFREALEQEQITPVGGASLEHVNFDAEPFTFRVTVPVAPTVTLPAYRDITVPAEQQEISDEQLDAAMDARRERHVVLREPDEPRPAQQGDQLTVHLETFVDGESLEKPEEGEEVPESTLVLEPGRLVDGLYEGLLGVLPDETRAITVHMPENHANEQVRDKDVIFNVNVKRVQERLLPDWDELPVLEETEGTLDELREKTRQELADTQRNELKNTTINEYLKQLVEQTDYDVPDALIDQEAHDMLHEQEQTYQRYGITLDQMLQYRGQTHDEAVEEMKPAAADRLKRTLALQQIVRREGFQISDAEVENEVGRLVETYDEAQRDNARNMLSTQLRSSVATGILNQKLSDRLFEIATGAAPALPEQGTEAMDMSTDATPGVTGQAKPESTSEFEGPTDGGTKPATPGDTVETKTESTSEFEGPTEDADQTAAPTGGTTNGATGGTAQPAGDAGEGGAPTDKASNESTTEAEGPTS